MEGQKNKKSIISIIAIGVAILFAGWFLFFRNPAKEEEQVAANAPIEGTVTFTALRPDPEDAEKGKVIIKYKPHNESVDFKSTGIELPVKNNEPWKWTGATSSVAYSLIAVLEVDGKELSKSEPATVTAPAVNVVLPLHIDWDDLPEDFLEKATTEVKGTAFVNGFIPSGSVLTISAKKSASENFVVTQTFNNPKASQSWVWPNAERGQEYNVKADLKQGTAIIGSTGSLTAIAGDNAVTMILTSRATPPQNSKATISGTVTVNGPLTASSTVDITAQPTDGGSMQQIAQIQNPTNASQNWQWDEANSGVSYQIMATLHLELNDQGSQSRTITVTAPASGVNFVINSGVSVATPTDKPELQSCSLVSGDVYNATIAWPYYHDASVYWFQIGTNPGGSNLLNQKTPATSQAPTPSTVQVTAGQNNFAQWAYALCANCNNDQNFSNFSTPFQFTCGSTATPSPTPEPSMSPTATPSVNQ